MGAITERIKAFLMSLFEFGWFYKLIEGDIGIGQFLLRGIPIIGWFYSAIFGMPEDEEEDSELDDDFDQEDEFRENGRRVMADGGPNVGNQNNRNSTVGNNRVGIDQGVYEDLSVDNPKGKLNSLASKKSFKIILVLMIFAGTVAGSIFFSPVLAIGGLLVVGMALGLLYGIHKKWGTAGLITSFIPITFFAVLVIFTGVGAGYGGLADDMFGSYTAGFGDIGSEVSYQAGRAVKTISCFGNAGCIREWQLNQTRRPGSEDVGETYELRVENLMVYGSDVGVDVAYQRPNAQVPVSFLLTNTRHGLKGINAENVDYRVKVRDERLVGGTDLCETDWLDLEKFGGNPPSDSDIFEDRLLPGEAVEPLNYASGEDSLNLQECGLLQPSAGTNMDFILQVRYDYSSQSTLQVDAMSRDHRRSEEIPIEFKNSETADTPVETYIEVRSPILFQDTDSGRTPIPFRSRIGVQTDERDIRYKIDTDDFEMTDSEITEALDCNGLDESGNTYTLAEQASRRIERRQREDWFSHRNQPVPVSCQFQIKESEVDSISPTGETLTMSADVSYTVLKEEQRESFEVANSLCTDYNCPMLIPLQSNSITDNIARKKLDEELEPGDDGYWNKSYAHCGRPQDAQQGCSVIRSFKLEDRSAGPITDQTVQQGEIALNVTGGGDITSEYVQNQVQKASEGENTEVDAALLPPRLVSITQDALESLYTQDCVLNITENPGSPNSGKEWVIQNTGDSSAFNSCG